MSLTCMLRGIAFILALVMALTPQTTSTKLPDTLPGRLMGEWLAMCAAPKAEQFAKWDAEHYSDRIFKFMPADKLVKNDLEDCSDSGSYRVVQVSDSKPDQIDLQVVSNRTDVWFHLSLTLDQDNKIAGFGAFPSSPPETALPREFSDAAVKAEIAAYADKVGKAGHFSGIVMLSRGTQPIVTQTEGYADRANKTVFTPSSQFTIGSMGKLFTSTAIGQLVDQGKISYDDVVGKFFPDFANKTVREKVTVGMLLSHTSGMRDFLGKRTPEMMKNGVRRAAEFIPLYEKDEPRFEPGTDWAYSNAGLALAGAIVEKVSGEDYPDYIRKHIFEQAGMRDSDPNNVPARHLHLVVPYTERSPNGDTTDWHEAIHDIGSPAGGAISTAEDLTRFAQALRSGKLVSKATFAKMIQPRGNPSRGSYGYGIQIDDLYMQTIVGHGGGFPGVSTQLYMVLGSPYTLVVLANQDPPAAEIIGERTKAIVAEKAKRGQ